MQTTHQDPLAHQVGPPCRDALVVVTQETPRARGVSGVEYVQVIRPETPAQLHHFPHPFVFHQVVRLAQVTEGLVNEHPRHAGRGNYGIASSGHAGSIQQIFGGPYRLVHIVLQAGGNAVVGGASEVGAAHLRVPTAGGDRRHGSPDVEGNLVDAGSLVVDEEPVGLAVSVDHVRAGDFLADPENPAIVLGETIDLAAKRYLARVFGDVRAERIPHGIYRCQRHGTRSLAGGQRRQLVCASQAIFEFVQGVEGGESPPPSRQHSNGAAEGSVLLNRLQVGTPESEGGYFGVLDPDLGVVRRDSGEFILYTGCHGLPVHILIPLM